MDLALLPLVVLVAIIVMASGVCFAAWHHTYSSYERVLLHRFRHFCRTKARGNRKLGVYTPSPFFDRIYGDPNAKLELGDFMAACGYDVPPQIVEVHHTYVRHRHRPFSHHYLVSTLVEGNIDMQTLTCITYEHRFSGPFALHRNPLWRRRETVIDVADFGVYYEQMEDSWLTDLDKDWRGCFGRRSAATIAVFDHKLGF